MPLYTYFCAICSKQKEVIHGMNKIKLPGCCGIKMFRDYQADLPNAGNRDYRKPIISDSLAINPCQIEEHRKLFPDIKVHPDGRPEFDNFKKHDDYLEKCGFVKMPKRNRRRFTSKIGGENDKKTKIRKNKTISK